MASLTGRFITLCMARPVDPKMGADLLNITPPQDQDVMKEMLDQPWNIHDKELIASQHSLSFVHRLTTYKEVCPISYRPT